MTLEEKQIKRNIERCDNLLAILAELSDSDVNKNNANIYLKINEIEKQITELQKLYEQIIP